MITVSHLIEQLSKFPQGAKVAVMQDTIQIVGSGSPGIISCPCRHRPKRTNMGSWARWMDTALHTAGGRIQRFLLEHPAEAREIAFSAIAGLYLGEDDETTLPEDMSYPRGSGADYVDHVGMALEASGIMPLIHTLQEEVEDG